MKRTKRTSGRWLTTYRKEDKKLTPFLHSNSKLVFRKKSDPIWIRRSDPNRFRSVFKFRDPKNRSESKKNRSDGCGSDRIIAQKKSEKIRSDSDRIFFFKIFFFLSFFSI